MSSTRQPTLVPLRRLDARPTRNIRVIGRLGRPVQFTIMRSNLIQPQPGLFL